MSFSHLRQRRARLCAALALVALGLACGGPKRRDTRAFENSPDNLAQLGGEQLELLARARARLEGGDPDGAGELLDAAAAAPGAPFALRRLHQEAWLLAAPEAASAHVEAARRRAEERPTCHDVLLWARVAPNAEQRRAALEQALALDPREPWAHYAWAHSRALEGDWGGAADAVQRALEIDPGHRAARRLEAAILARGARSEEAVNALEVWLDATVGDPRVGAGERASARLDLAHLVLERGNAARALELLRAVHPSEGGELTRWCLIAAAEQAAGRPVPALEAAQNAARSSPADLTPKVQIALLRQYDLRDAEGATAAWRAVLDATRGATDLAALIQGLRARIVLERGAGAAP